MLLVNDDEVSSAWSYFVWVFGFQLCEVIYLGEGPQTIGWGFSSDTNLHNHWIKSKYESKTVLHPDAGMLSTDRCASTSMPCSCVSLAFIWKMANAWKMKNILRKTDSCTRYRCFHSLSLRLLEIIIQTTSLQKLHSGVTTDSHIAFVT